MNGTASETVLHTLIRVVIGEEVQKVVWSIEQYVIVDAFW